MLMSAVQSRTPPSPPRGQFSFGHCQSYHCYSMSIANIQHAIQQERFWALVILERSTEFSVASI